MMTSTWIGPRQGARRPGHAVPDPVAPAQVRPAFQHVGPAVGGGIQSEQGHLALARPLPGRRRRLDPAERADPRPGSGHDQGRAQGALGRAGREPLNHRIGDYANEIPPGPPRPGPDACDWKAPRVHAMLETHIRGEKKAAAGQPAGVPAPRHDQRGLEPRHLQVHRRPTRRSPAAARAPSTSSSSCTPTRARCSTVRTTRTG